MSTSTNNSAGQGAVMPSKDTPQVDGGRGERMSKVEIDLLWKQIGMLAKLAPGIASAEDLYRLQRENDFAQSFGCFIDPTAYMRMDRRMVVANRELLDATTTYIAAVERLVPIIRASAPPAGDTRTGGAK